MRWQRWSRRVRAGTGLWITLLMVLVIGAVSPALASNAPTTITINGHEGGTKFGGVGAISGGGGTARLLIDYPPAQQTQILNYLFGPGGADLQILKLEIGGDTAQSDGSEPAVLHTENGTIDCNSGYSWWLAEQAVARNPNIVLMGLQWSAPGWVGNSIWDPADIGYIIDWLNCAKSHNLNIGYVGGWNEHGYIKSWYEGLRAALNANGFSSVKIVAADSFPGIRYIPARTWNVAAAAATDPKFKAALSVIGSHDTCGGPTTGYACESTKIARQLGLPLWESEIGTLHGSTAPANMARVINNGFIEAGITGFLTWPMSAAQPPGLFYTDRGLVIADEPQSGNYHVQPITWALAQTTQFVQPGWRHVTGASGDFGGSGNYDAYVSPDKHDWSLVAENTGNHSNQNIKPETITVHLTGGLTTSNISVWSTNVDSSSPSQWFVHRADAHVVRGTFSFTVQPCYVVSFTSTTGQAHWNYTPPPPSSMTLPYTATPDASNEAWGLDSQEGSFLYEPCLGGATGVNGQCIEQMAPLKPVFWQTPEFGTPTPYALVGAPSWTNYTVSSDVLFTNSASSAGLISRFTDQGNDPKHFDGYQFDLQPNGNWQLLSNAAKALAVTLAHGTVAGITTNTWHTLALEASGTEITASIDGTQVAQVTNTSYGNGLAGIESNWSEVQYNNLTVTAPPP
jgi:Glycosyl hydrolase family 59